MVSTAYAQEAKPEAEVLHWFTTGTAAASLGEISKDFEEAGGVWIDNAVASGEAARAVGFNRMVGGVPPSAMMLNVGRQTDDLIDQGLLAPIDDAAAASGWIENAVGPIKDAVTRNGHIYGAPTNVNGNNWLFYNKTLLDQVDAPVPDTWENFWDALDKLKAGGITALAVGAQPWQISMMFNHTLAGLGGHDLYLKVFADRDVDAVKSPAFREVVDAMVKMRDYQDPGSPNREWNIAANMLITGQAAIQIHGDWSQAEFDAAGWDDYGCVLGTGDKSFIMGGDMFVFPKLPEGASVARKEGQALLATVMLAADTQVAYNEYKSSVPSRTDATFETIDRCKAQALEAMANPAQTLPADNMLLLPDAVGALSELEGELWAGTVTAEDFVARFANAIAYAE
jgi:glucose/mannose transport system substrate-binding protein